MAAQTTFLNSILNAAFRGATYTGGTITMKLFTVGLPSGTGVEVSGGGYSAQTLTFSAAALKKVATSADVVFTNLPTATVLAYGVYSNGVLIDEALLSPSYTADVSNNTLTLSYEFDLAGA